MVQSICLTSRGSAVRPRHPPHSGREESEKSGSFFCVLQDGLIIKPFFYLNKAGIHSANISISQNQGELAGPIATFVQDFSISDINGKSKQPMRLLISHASMLKTPEKYSVAAEINLTIFARTGYTMNDLRQNINELLLRIVI